VGVTGASGAVLAQKMLGFLDADARVERIHLVVTETGLRLFAEELAIPSSSAHPLVQRILGHPSQKIEVISNKDVGASIASGSYAVDAMAGDSLLGRHARQNRRGHMRRSYRALG